MPTNTTEADIIAEAFDGLYVTPEELEDHVEEELDKHPPTLQE